MGVGSTLVKEWLEEFEYLEALKHVKKRAKSFKRKRLHNDRVSKAIKIRMLVQST